MFNRRITAATAVVATLALAACEDSKPRAAVGGIPLGDYVMVGIGNGTVPLRNVTLQLSEDSIAGRGPCNGYGAKNTADLPALALSGFTSTNATCKDQALEERFFNALRQATEMEYYGGVLRVKGPTWLIFERGVPASLATSGVSALEAARGTQ